MIEIAGPRKNLLHCIRRLIRLFSESISMTNRYRLHRGRSKKPILELVADSEQGLWRIAWPDIGLSDRTNLTRAKAAALEWAERKVLTEGRNWPVARRLKSLNNFSWSASYIAPNSQAAITLPAAA